MRGGGGRPRVHLDVSGTPVTALIDTGSTHTIVNSSLYHKLPRLTPLLPAPRIQSITNHSLPIQGKTTLKICGQAVEVLVCEGLGVDLLVGANLCKATVLDFKNQIFEIGGRIYPITTKPEYLCPLVQATMVPKACSPCIDKVLQQYDSVFSKKDTPLGIAKSLPPAVINTTTTRPIRQRSYRLPFSKRETVETCVEEMLRDGVIRPSDSPWASPITLVPKKDGSTRFCVDYRQLNAVTIQDAHPLPHIQDIFDELKGAQVFSTLDLRSGYWQVPVAEESVPKTAFTCHLGLFEFVRMPFGLTNAPAIFQRAMNKVLSGLIGKICMVYIDDIVIFSNNVEQHAYHLSLVLERLSQAGLQLKPSKCSFELPEIELLGFVVGKNGIQPQAEKVAAIKNLLAPTDQKAVRSFLGMVGYYRQCIPGFANLAFPLTELTKPRQPFIWGQEQQEAFELLKKALITSPILAHPDPSKPYTLYTDASDKAVGAILVQLDGDGIERVIAYASHKLSGAQLHWPVIEKEAYGVVYALKKFHPYLWGAKFEIHTDHKPLKSMFTSEIRNTKVQRWAINIAEYGAPILYHPGRLNIRADMLSRIAAVAPPTPLIPTPRDVPAAWEADGIDPISLMKHQQDQFADQITEASQDTDETPYVMESGLLYSLAEPYKNAGRYMRLVLPQQHRQVVIDRCHQETGHSGLIKTLSRVQEHYVWPGMRRSARLYLESCVLCNTLTPSSPSQPRGAMPIPPTPFHTWGIDLVGPFPPDKKGRQYLLTCIDHLTGWAEAFPIRSKRNDLIWEVLVEQIVARYGVPAIIVSDNGGEFTSKKFEAWLREHGINHKLTSPYHPQTNGKVERFNGTIQKLLLKLTGGNPKKWSAFLPDALYAYRITAGPSGVTPFKAIHGFRPRLSKTSVELSSDGDRFQAVRTALSAIIEEQEKSKARYAAGEPAKAKTLAPGLFVAIRVLNPRKGQAKWKPGFQVLSSFQGALRVQELETGTILRLNQRQVREIPSARGYDEIDPLPPRPHRTGKPIPDNAAPIPIPPPIHCPTHIPTAALCQPFPAEWQAWCAFIQQFTQST